MHIFSTCGTRTCYSVLALLLVLLLLLLLWITWITFCSTRTCYFSVNFVISVVLVIVIMNNMDNILWHKNLLFSVLLAVDDDGDSDNDLEKPHYSLQGQL